MTTPVRYKFTIAYRGTHYHGWQKQAVPASYEGEILPDHDGIPTVQEIVARALMHVLGHPINLVGSSRTDSGVHAKGQLAHVDTDQTQIPVEGLRQAVNARLPADILVRTVEPVPMTFSAVRSTASKRYQYAIWNALDRSPFLGELTWHRRQPLDVKAMREAARLLVGTHDFASFAKPGHGRESTVRTILDCSVSSRGPMLVIGVEGKGFLWNMVRIIVGTLVEVGAGRHPPAAVSTMLAARDRRAAGPTAPPQGLFLQWIKTREAGAVPVPLNA